MTADSLAQRLAELVSTRVPSEARAWFASALAAADASADPAGFALAFAGAGRRLGRPASLAELTEEERRALTEAGMTVLPETWGLDEIGRAALLLKGLTPLPGSERARLLAELYQKGELREQQAVLRALAYLPDPGDFLAVAVGSCRTHAQSVFEAIACENPYPAAYFPELNFNQMVLKAIFTGAAVERIVGLDGRITPDLVRMAEGYASERRAAGRAVPEDVARITAGPRRAS